MKCVPEDSMRLNLDRKCCRYHNCDSLNRSFHRQQWGSGHAGWRPQAYFHIPGSKVSFEEKLPLQCPAENH